MSKTNTLTSHWPESSNSRADKMSGSFSRNSSSVGKSKRFVKKFYSKKRRQLLKSTDKI